MNTQQKFRRLQTSTRILWVRENEDGSLFITDDFEKSLWNAGLLINQLGGIDKVKNRLQGEELTKEEAEAYMQERHAYNVEMRKNQAKRQAEKEIEKAKQRKADYEALLERSVNGVIETTYENIGIVLRYLNTINWGGWDLPKMTIGYSCNQYDCDGKTATTMKLDKAIKLYEDEDETESMFQVGAPFGHLTKYRRS
ncbi:MAG: hypothetical protein U0J38_01125 [Bacteroidales bacterium]|nr:hypothetical protein [Bacteroidales bacterium]